MRTMLESEEQQKSDPEVTLSMISLLGIFFALVVVCGVFFGFGYSVGKHSGSAKATGTAGATPGSLSGKSMANLLAADSAPLRDLKAPASRAAPTRSPESPESSANEAPAAGVPAPRSNRRAVSSDSITQAVASSPVSVDPGVRKGPGQALAHPDGTVAIAAPREEQRPAPEGASAFMVQIAAVSHPEDGQVLIAALRKRGYNVSARSEPQDKLMHVQIGPFATRADANVMRQKLLGDGYNAIVK